MKRYILMLLLIVGLSLFSVTGFLFFTSAGLVSILNLAGEVISGDLQVDKTSGSLAGGFVLNGIRFSDAANTVVVDRLSVSWRPSALINKKLIMREIEVSGIDVRMTGGSAAGENSNRRVAPAAPPLPVILDNVTVTDITIHTAGQPDPEKIETIVLKNISWEDTSIQIGHSAVSASSYTLSVEGHLLLENDISAELAVAYSFLPAGYNSFEGEGNLTGSLSEMHFSTHLQKPIEGTVSGRISQIFEEPAWQAVLDADDAALPAVNPGWPQFAFSAFHAEGEGDLTKYSVEVDTKVDYEYLQDMHLATRLAGDAGGLHFSGTRILHGDAELEGQGWLNWEKQFSWAASVSGKEVDFTAIHPDWPEVFLSSVDIYGQGKGQQYTFELQADGKYRKFDRPVHAIANCTGNAEGIRISEASFTQDDAQLEGEAQLNWQEAFFWNARIKGHHLNPAMWNPEFAGNIDLQLQSEGKVEGKAAAGYLEIALLEGVIRDYPITAKGRADFIGQDLRLHEVSLETAGTNIKASGYFTDTVDLQFEGSSSDLSVIWPELEGSIGASGYIRGQRNKPAIVMDLSGENIKGFGNSIGKTSGAITADLTPDGQIDATFTASQVSVAERQIDVFRADINGTTSEHTLNIDVSGDTGNLVLYFKGGKTDGVLNEKIEQAEIRSKTYGAWHLVQPGTFRVTNTGLDVEVFCLAGMESARVCLGGKLNTNDGWEIATELKTFPLVWFQQAAGVEVNIKVQGDISGSGRFAGRDGVLQNGRLILTSENASAHLELDEGDEYELAWSKNILEFEYSDNVLKTEVESILSDGSRVVTTLRSDTVIPISAPIEEIPVNGKINIDIKNLDSLTALTFPLVEPSGILAGDVALSGTLGNPLFEGKIQLTKGKMGVPKAGILIENLDIKLAGKRNEIDLVVSGNSGGGEIIADGMFTFEPESEPVLQMAVRGKNFEAVGLPELRLAVSPELDLLVNRQEIQLTGMVRIDEGVIAPYSIVGAVDPSRDVVFVRKNKKNSKEELPVSADLQIIVNNKVAVNAFGLKGKLQGNIRIINEPGKLATATGNLDVVDGTFAVYGRELTIKTGQLLFSGGPVYDPGISVRAENTTKDVTTGIAVSGFLREPEIDFYSEPPMEENEIISRLLMNTTLVGDADNDSGLITTATSDSKLAPIGSIIKGTKDAFRVDEVRVETGKNSEDLSLVIGTWITPSLYLSYGKNLLKESGSFNTRYMLGYGFSLETETGSTESGIDLKYQIEK